jgi:hypothetical protein
MKPWAKWALAAVLFAIAALAVLIQAVSGASLACVACDCTYTITAANPRCRWPALFGMAFWVLGVASLVLGIIAIYRAMSRGASVDR